MASENAVILIDLINDMVAQDGKLARRGYYDFITRHDVGKSLGRLLKLARDKGWLVAHVRIGFSPSYAEHPAGSPLLGGAKQFKALCLGEPGTEFNAIAKPLDGEVVITKSRVSPFYGTSLESVLRNNGVKNIYIAGVGTDMAVQSAARDAHDRDFAVYVVGDCCGTGSDVEHQNALQTLGKISKVLNVDDIR